MTFVAAHRFSGVTRLRGWSMLRAGRPQASRLCVRRIPNPQERVDLYVSRMPIAVLTAAPRGRSSGSVGNH